MEMFEDSENPDNVRRWMQLGEHHVVASGAPGRRTLERWRDAGVTDVITLQRADEMAPWLAQACAERSLRWHHAPVSGKRLQAKGDAASLADVIRIVREMDAPSRVVVHCSAGLHRTGVALYLLLRAQGLSPQDSLARIEAGRALTARELTRTPRHGERLAQTAETMWSALQGS